MPAIQFFSIFRAAKEVEWKKQGHFFYEMLHVSVGALGDKKYNTAMAKHYRERFDPAQPTEMLDNQTAGMILTKMLGGGV